MNKLNIAIVGPSSNIGQEILKTLAEREFPIEKIVALASKETPVTEVSFGEEETLIVKSIEGFDFSSFDICFFASSEKLAKAYIPAITKAGCIVIDSSHAFAMDPDIPLIVPEANAHALADYSIKNIIASPSSISCQLATVLKPLHDLATVKRVVVSTYQAVSDEGRDAMDELFSQTRAIFANAAVQKHYFAKQIAFNVIPQIGEFREDGSTEEEFNIVVETKKIIDPTIKISASCARVPLFIGHGQNVNIEFDYDISAEQARTCLDDADGVAVIDHQHEDGFATPVETAGEDNVFVSRIREDISVENGLNLWITGDNLRKGAALNLVQIAETLARDYL